MDYTSYTIYILWVKWTFGTVKSTALCNFMVILHMVTWKNFMFS